MEDTQILNQYEKLFLIGSGNYGDVYKIKNKQTEEFLAAKILKTPNDQLSSAQYRNIQRETEIPSEIRHPLIIKYIGYSPIDFEKQPKSVIITELINNGSLKNIITLSVEDQLKIGWNDTLKLANIYGIAYALYIMHSNNAIHRDLKPDNIFVDNFLCPKIADFGLSKQIHYNASITSESLEIKGTPNYIAPEIFDDYNYSKAGDVYAFAMIVYEIVTNKRPFENIKNISKLMIFVISGGRPDLYSTIPTSYRNLIKKCWDHDPSKRPTFAQILEKLRTDPGFITANVIKEDFEQYIKFVDQLDTNSDQSKCITDIDKFCEYKSKTFTQKVINPQFLVASEINDIFVKAKKFKEGDEESKIPINIEEATRLFEIAANCGHVDAMLEFGKIQLNGDDEDKLTGANYLKKAADLDNVEAMYLYGLALSNGDGVPVDHVESCRYLEMASNKGHIEAKYHYGMKLLKGIGIEARISKARSLLRESAYLGHPRAMYEYGISIKKNNKREAANYLKMSSDLGVKEATDAYARILYELNTLDDFTVLNEYIKEPEIKKGIIISTSQPVAIKYAINCTFDDLMHESDILIKCTHPSIQKLVGLYESSSDPSSSAMITQYCTEGSLDNYLQSMPIRIIDDDDDNDEDEENLDDFKLHYRLIYHICQAMKYLEENNMFHGLLNPSNILLDDDLNPILNNIKMKENYSKDELEHPNMMINYLAPEILLGNNNSIKSDVYSFGLIIEQIFTGKVPYSTMETKQEIINAVTEMNINYKISELVPKFLRSIVEKCLDKNPANRQKFQEIFNQLENLFKKNKAIDYYQNILDAQIKCPVTFFRIPKIIVKSPEILEKQENQNKDTNQDNFEIPKLEDVRNQTLISFDTLYDIFSTIPDSCNIKIIMVCGIYQSGKSALLRRITGNGAFYSGICCETTTLGMVIDGPYYVQDIVDRINLKSFKSKSLDNIEDNTVIFFIDSQGIGDKKYENYSDIMKHYFSFFCALSDVCINISNMSDICTFFNGILNTIRRGQLMNFKFGGYGLNQDDTDANKTFTKILFLARNCDYLNTEIKTKKGFKSIQQKFQEDWDKQHADAYEYYPPNLFKAFPLGHINASPLTYNCSVWNIIPEIFEFMQNSINYNKKFIINKIENAVVFLFSDFFEKFKKMNDKIDEQINFIADFSLKFVNNLISQYQSKKIDKEYAIDSMNQFLNMIASMIIPYTIGQNINLSTQDCNQYAYDLMKDIISYLRKNIPELERNLFNSVYELYLKDILMHSLFSNNVDCGVSGAFISEAAYFQHEGAISRSIHFIGNIIRYYKKNSIVKKMTNERIETSIPFLWDKIDCDQKSVNMSTITNPKKFLPKVRNCDFIVVLESKASTFMKFIIQSMTGIKCDFENQNENKETILYGPFSPDYFANRFSRCFPTHKSSLENKIYVLYLRDYSDDELNQIADIQEKSLFCLSSNESIGSYPPIKNKLLYMFYFIQKPEIKLLKKKECDDIQTQLNHDVPTNGYNISYLPIMMENHESLVNKGPQTNKNLRWAFHRIFGIKSVHCQNE